MRKKIPGILCVFALATMAMVGALPAHADDSPTLERVYPTEESHVDPGTVTFQGRVSRGSNEKNINVVFAVDVSSGAAGSPGMDCNGDHIGGGDHLDDFNHDDGVGDILDCQIATVHSLTEHLRTLEGEDRHIHVNIVAYAKHALVGLMNRKGDTFVSPSFFESNVNDPQLKEHFEAVHMVASSLKIGEVGIYEKKTTNPSDIDINTLLNATIERLNSREGESWIFLLSGGVPQPSQKVLDRLAEQSSKIHVKTYGVGNDQSMCDEGKPLHAIAQASGEKCTKVTNPFALTTGLDQASTHGVKRVVVNYRGTEYEAQIDAFGNWSANVPDVEAGKQRAFVSVIFDDGTQPLFQSWGFTVGHDFKQVALGDSYSAGEGLSPYIGHDESGREHDIRFLCHQSLNSWPSMLTPTINGVTHRTEKHGGTFVMGACSGAEIPNFDRVKQEKNWYGGPSYFNELQLDYLTPDTDLVTLTIGGNDLGFGPIISTCINPLTACLLDRLPGSNLELQHWVKIRLANLKNEYRRLYGQIRERVGEDATVIVGTYPRLYEFRESENCGITHDVERLWLSQVANTLAEITIDEAQRTTGPRPPRFLVADVRAAFTGKGACAYPWNSAVTVLPAFWRSDDISANPISAAALHPNERGAKIYAKEFNDLLRRAPFEFTERAQVEPNGEVEDEPAGPVDPTDWSYFTDVVENPEAVLASYPKEVVEEVTSTSFATLLVGKKKEHEHEGAQCDAVVSREMVPARAFGFSPQTPVTFTLRSFGEGNGKTLLTESVTAQQDGSAELELVMPEDLRQDKLTLEVEGQNTAGGKVIGMKNLESTTSQDCIEQADAAGAVQKKTPPTPRQPVPPPQTGTPAPTPPVKGSGQIARTGADLGSATLVMASLGAAGTAAFMLRAMRRGRRG